MDQYLGENPAFYSRIKRDIVTLEPIAKRGDKHLLIQQLNALFETKKNEEQLKKYISEFDRKMQKSEIYSNRDMLRFLIGKLLAEAEVFLSLKDSLSEYNLLDLFDSTKEEIELSDEFKNLSRKFFDPLKYYLEETGFELSEKALQRQRRIFFKEDLNEMLYFIFNEHDKERLNEDVEKVKSLIGKNKKVNFFLL